MAQTSLQAFRAALRGRRLTEMRLSHPQRYIALLEQTLLDADDIAVRHAQLGVCDAQDEIGAYQTERAALLLEDVRRRRIVRYPR